MAREFLTRTCSKEVQVGTPEAGSRIRPMCFLYLFQASNPTENTNVTFLLEKREYQFFQSFLSSYQSHYYSRPVSCNMDASKTLN